MGKASNAMRNRGTRYLFRTTHDYFKRWFRKFLNPWKDAEPGIVEVEDPKKRLVGLK
ncbi:MAG: hypothetical protein ACFFCW_21075 [Candidatus Hodarchaeota archaeon]